MPPNRALFLLAVGRVATRAATRGRFGVTVGGSSLARVFAGLLGGFSGGLLGRFADAAEAGERGVGDAGLVVDCV